MLVETTPAAVQTTLNITDVAVLCMQVGSCVTCELSHACETRIVAVF
jgi:hypothetical protein